MKVPFLSLQESYEEISEEINLALQKVLSSGRYIGGSEVELFEEKFSEYVGSKYCVGIGNGLDAIQAILKALDIGQGDEVIVPSHTFIATWLAVSNCGAKPIPVEVNQDTYSIELSEIEKALTKKTKAIVPVHLYGNVAYLDKISEIAKKFNIPIIEDSAQSLGSTFKNKHTGTFFEMGCYSMYPAKVMTAGEGGFIVTNSKKLRDKLLMIRNHGMVKGYDSRMLGLNLRLPEINAAIAKIQMKKLPKFLQARQKNAELLTELLSKSNLSLPIQRKYEKVNWYLYTVTSPKRNTLLKKLNEKGVGAASYYPIPVHKTPFYKSKTKLPITEWAASKVLSLPIHPKVTTKNIKFISKSIFEIL